MDTREAMEAAYDQHEAALEDDHANDPPPKADDRGGEAPPEKTADTGKVDGKQEETTTADDKVAKGRDAAGKFTSTSKPDADKVLADGKTEEIPAAGKQVAPPAVRGPVSWRPEVREKFASIPKEVQDEVVRREKEIETTLRDTAGARQFAQTVSQVVQPYEAMIRAEGGNAVSAIDALLKTAYHLRTANPQQKAIMVAHMIQQHGVDVALLDGALSQIVQGRQVNPQTDATMQYLQRELGPIKQFVTGLQQRQQQLTQSQTQDVQSEYEAFAADPANEFLPDVADIMADMMDSAAKRNQKMSLQDAYRRATLAHPSISEIIAARQVSATAAQRSAATRRARNASASLPSGGAPAGAAESAKPATTRSAVEAAWDALEQR